ncbi:Peptide transport system permease protein sapC [Sphingomonas sp. LH128]|uniref:SapC family protein n=1 Tax=Sphingomonadales TaxID=204457 RepID=UPI00027CB1F7|nr:MULTISPECIES: SapC family protein [Sphingomonadaceae]EJU12132.1 Peptide transport system permease protein sapC [Sphingomonas sp. LH128]MBJ7376343.1 SapC family protein [Sphingobium sp.]
MTDPVSQAAPAADQPLLPLFYKAVQPLNSQVHGDWRLTAGDASFARETPFVPIVASEIPAAARSYPIVFAADGAQPIAVLGLERRNLFVADGCWTSEDYVPAYVRRYPFAFVATDEPRGVQLAIDSGSDRVAQGGSEGAPLFADGQPSELTAQALEFCVAFGRDAELTALFATALREKGLLIDRRADATLPDGRKLGLDGFQIVDTEKFAALDNATVLAWHRQGVLGLVHHHLASLERFNTLLGRQARLIAGDAPVMQTSPTDASSDPAAAAATADLSADSAAESTAPAKSRKA